MMVRRVLGSLAGVVTSTLVIMAAEWVSHVAVGAADPGAVPASLHVLVILGWTLGALIGGLVGGKVARWRGAPWIVGGLVALGVVLNAMNLPQPLWVTLAGLALALAAAWLSASLTREDQRVAL